MSYHKRCQNVYQRIKGQCDLTSLTDAINSASPIIKQTLETADPLTVFAPTNKAFKNVPECGSLDEILLYHVVPEYLPACK